MDKRYLVEQFEDEENSLRKEIFSGEEQIETAARKFQRIQDNAYEYALSQDILDDEVKYRLERNEAEFFEAKDKAIRLLESKQEELVEMQRTHRNRLETL
ncbi:hypothetical protein RyT2_12150 [Pseudolactococcus yaeyamensis]